MPSSICGDPKRRRAASRVSLPCHGADGVARHPPRGQPHKFDYMQQEFGGDNASWRRPATYSPPNYSAGAKFFPYLHRQAISASARRLQAQSMPRSPPA